MKSLIATALFLTTLSAFGASDGVLDAYRTVSTALAADRFSETRDTALRVIPALEAWLQDHPAADRQAPHVTKMLEGARLLGATSDEEALRTHYSVFSEGATKFIKFDPAQTSWQLFFCHMVHGRFPYWAQPKSDKMANPYMGLKMLQCGVKRPWTALP